MNKYVSAREQYFKKTQAKNLIAHIERTMKENKNVLPSEHIKYENEYSENIDLQYKKIVEDAKIDYEKNNNQSFDNIQNLYIESVVSFSQEHFFEVYEKDSSQIKIHIEKYIKDIEKTFKIKSAGWSLHLDEGHINKEGKVVYNPHIHISWVNYDFELHKTSWRNIQRKDFSKFQDKIFENFKDLGFERGISKEITKKSHLDKDEYIQEKHKGIVKNLETISDLYERLESDSLSLETIDRAKKHFKGNKLVTRVLNNLYRIVNSDKESSNQVKNMNNLMKNIGKLEDDESELLKFLSEGKSKLKQTKQKVKNIEVVSERTEEKRIDEIINKNITWSSTNKEGLKEDFQTLIDGVKKHTIKEQYTLLSEQTQKVEDLESERFTKIFSDSKEVREVKEENRQLKEYEKRVKEVENIDKEEVVRENTYLKSEIISLTSDLAETQKLLDKSKKLYSELYSYTQQKLYEIQNSVSGGVTKMISVFDRFFNTERDEIEEEKRILEEQEKIKEEENRKSKVFQYEHSDDFSLTPMDNPQLTP